MIIERHCIYLCNRVALMLILSPASAECVRAPLLNASRPNALFIFPDTPIARRLRRGAAARGFRPAVRAKGSI